MIKHTVFVLASEGFKGKRLAHFIDQPLAGNDLWFPIGNRDIKQEIEDILKSNDIALKIIRVEKMRDYNTDFCDYHVIYDSMPIGN